MRPPVCLYDYIHLKQCCFIAGKTRTWHLCPVIFAWYNAVVMPTATSVTPQCAIVGTGPGPTSLYSLQRQFDLHYFFAYWLKLILGIFFYGNSDSDLGCAFAVWLKSTQSHLWISSVTSVAVLSLWYIICTSATKGPVYGWKRTDIVAVGAVVFSRA